MRPSLLTALVLVLRGREGRAVTAWPLSAHAHPTALLNARAVSHANAWRTSTHRASALMAAKSKGKAKSGGRTQTRDGQSAAAGAPPPSPAASAAFAADSQSRLDESGVSLGASVEVQGEVRAVSAELAAAQATVAVPRVVVFGGNPLMRMPPEQWVQLRLPAGSTPEAVHEALRNAISREQLAPFVGANRDFTIKRFQLWLMAEALRQKSSGDTRTEQATRSALSALIKANREFDAPLAFAVAARELALNQAFEKASESPDANKPSINALAGPEPLDKLGFWIVIASAKEAWLERLSELSPADTSLRDAIVRKVGQMDQFLEAVELTPEVQVPPMPVLLQALSKNEVKQEAINDQLIFELGSILGCLECLRYQAFSALALRLSVLMDVIAVGELRPIQMGAALGLPSALAEGAKDGSLSTMIRYEIEQGKLDTRDSTIKLASLLGLGSSSSEAAAS